MTKIRMITLGVISIILLLLGGISVFAATDYSNQVKVVDWELRDASGNALSTTNAPASTAKYQLYVKWELIPDSATLQEGDTFKIPLPQNEVAGTWTVITSAWIDFTDASNVVLGQWRLNGGNIEIKIGSGAEGSNSIGAEFLTGTNAIMNSTSYDGIQNVTLGGISKPIKFLVGNISAIKGDKKYASTTSNNSVR